MLNYLRFLASSLAFLAITTAVSAETLIVGEAEIIKRVISSAPEAQIAREDLGIAEASLASSKSVFDTSLSVEANYTRDELARSSTFFGTRKDTTNWDLGLSKKLPSGTSTSIDWTNQRIKLFNVPTISGTTVFPTDPTYESIVKLSISQPLLKNFGGLSDRKQVDAARLALKSSGLATKTRIASAIHRALSLYWQWVIADANASVWARSVADAGKFLDLTLERKRLGTAEETDVLAARANLLNRKNGFAQAEILRGQIVKELKVILDLSSEDTMRPKDSGPRETYNKISDADTEIASAFSKRWDYLAQKSEVERQNIGLVSARNKRWPELDLIGTLSLNELTTSYSSTLQDVDNPSWTVGAALSIPLENREARAETKKMRHEEAKAVILLKSFENEISNSVAELVSRLKSNLEVVANAKKAEELQKEKLRQETDKYEIGRSNSETIIRYQDERQQAGMGALNAWSAYLQTVLDLKLAKNELVDL